MSLASRLLLLVMLALLPTLAIQGWAGFQQAREREAALEADAIAETRAARAAVARVTEGVHELLEAVAQTRVVREGDWQGCTDYLASLNGKFRSYGLLAVNGVDGMVLCNSAGVRPGGYSNAGRAYLERALREGGFVAGDLVTGTMTRARSVHFALPFTRMDGTTGGIVLAGVHQDWLAQQLVGLALPAGAVAALLDPSGGIVTLVRDGRPIRPELVGRPAPEALRRAAQARAPGVMEVSGLVDGPLLIGMVGQSADQAGLGVVVALDRTLAFAGLQAAWRRSLLSIVLGGALAMLGGLVFGRRLVLVPLGRLAAAAARVGRGGGGGVGGGPRWWGRSGRRSTRWRRRWRCGRRSGTGR